MIPDLNIQIIDFKCTSGAEMVTPNEDGSFTILINARLSSDAQHKALLHALGHILNCDFDKEDVQRIEAAAHMI